MPIAMGRGYCNCYYITIVLAYTKEAIKMEYPVLDVKAVGARIKTLRKAHSLKVEDVAEFMGFESVQAVYKWQRGESLPTVDNLYALSRLFGTSVDAILCGNEEKDESPSLPVFGGFFFELPVYYQTTRQLIPLP